jgi:DNA-binding HxlR family transcriptional regulator
MSAATRPDRADWTDAQPALAALSGKWTLPIMEALCRGPCRHRDLARTLGPEVSSKVLSAALRRLEQLQLIERQVTGDQSVVYTLAALGRSLHPVVAELSRWTREHWIGQAPGRRPPAPAGGAPTGGR